MFQEKFRRENQNTNFLFPIVFRKSCRLQDTVEPLITDTLINEHLQ
jgi:hypothetical protein